MKKTELRKKYLEKRKNLSAGQTNEFSKGIFKQFLKNFEVKPGQKAHVFLSISKFREVQTALFIKYFCECGLKLFVPKILNGRMISVAFTNQTKMEVSDWGIAEPVENKDTGVTDFDFVITPLLYCDSKGNRVGFGKGYYDSFFQKISPECKKIGVSFFEPAEIVDDITEFDVKLDYLLTPDKILSFKGLL